MNGSTARPIVVTGLSGSGRREVGKVFEDLGGYVVDNIPASMMLSLLDRMSAATPPALMVLMADVRGRSLGEDLAAATDALRRCGYRPRLLFVDARDDVLVRRFADSRLPHPLQSGRGLTRALAAERAWLAPARAVADAVIDTSNLDPAQLRDRIAEFLRGAPGERLRILVSSFGFKYGPPLDVDFQVDTRFLPNPYWVDELRGQNGRRPAVRDYVLTRTGAARLIDEVATLIGDLAEDFAREGRWYLAVGCGCTGGKHRSVAIAEELARRLGEAGASVGVAHRDLGRE